MSPRVDIIIPTYNGREHLAVCLPALQRQTCRDFRLIVVDDASTDGTPAFVNEIMPDATVIVLPQNAGLAVAINTGIASGDAELVAMLNNDTEPEPDWLENLVAGLDRHTDAGAAASKLMLFDRRDHIHSAGDTFSVRGVPGNRGVWERDAGQYNTEDEVFGACAGAALYRRAALEAVARIDGAVLDPDFFMYCEDVDLNWRLRLLGYGIVFVPSAVIYHRLSATGGGSLASYYVARNTISVMTKDVPDSILRKHLGAIMRHQMRDMLATLPHLREPAARARVRGTLAGLIRIPKFLSRRRRIQAACRAGIESIEQMLVP